MTSRALVRAAAFTLAVGLAGGGPARAAGELAPSAAASSAAPAGPAFADLPKLAPLSLQEPDAEALDEVDRIFDRLLDGDAAARTAAKQAIAEAAPSLVPALRHRVQAIRKSLDREAAPRLLEAVRKAGRKSAGGKSDDKSKKKPKKDTDGDEAAEGDWLDFALAAPRPKDAAWRDLVRLLAVNRMLAAIGTTPAVRELIAQHAYFGDLLRIDLQRHVARLRDKAVPALIEARQHDAKIVQRWANRQLDSLGRAIPGEAVGASDPEVLADVLRAYGRTRDVDAVRVLLSFANSDRIQLRDAAREAIAAIGEPGIWQLRDAYLNLTGEKPPRAYGWDRIARELFGTYDRARMAEVYELMDQGLALQKEGKLPDAVDEFDKVLSRSPLFERRKEMVPAYVAHAAAIAGDRPDEALAVLRKALRLDPASDGARGVEAEIAYLEGALLVARGTPDKFLFRRTLELDPAHPKARDALASLEDAAVVRQSYLRRYLGAGAVGFVALLAMVLLMRRRKEPTAPLTPSPAPSPSADEAPAEPETSPVKSDQDERAD